MAGRVAGGGRVAVVGSLNVDLVVSAGRWPDPGETLSAGSGVAILPGGKGLNQAGAAARAGAAVSLVGRIGSDALAGVLRGALADEGLDGRWVEADPEAGTGVALIRVGPKGENAILVVPGANGALSGAQAERAAEAIAAARVLLLQGEVPLAASLRAAQIGRAAGTAVVWNPAPAPSPGPETERLLALADWVLLNEAEVAALGGASGEEGARALAPRCGGRVVVTLGAEGALLVGSPDAPARRWRAHPVPVADTVGAGDAFAGALAAALAADRDPERAVREAMAAGALACTRPGGLPSMPRREEILRLADRG
jgi:ribokinase